jgi:transglutaminase-like putative cysteine protease
MIRFTRQVFFIIFFFFFLLSCESKNPVISSIDPKIGRMGEVITLTGSSFGASREESYVSIAGITPTGSSYYLWQDNLIIVRIPELGESGLVYVHSKGKKSNGVLFSNSASVPRPIEGEEIGLGPRITNVNPQTGAPGTLITITGSNFGAAREAGGGIFFSWDYMPQPVNPFVVREPEFIEVSETELGYESWNAREIRIRLPDGAVSGNIELRTSHGSPRPVFFDISGKPGNKNFTDKRSYTINYSVDIRVLEATRPNTLYLWMPKPISSSSQRNVSLVSRNIEPFIENHRGVSLYKLDNLGAGSTQSIDLSFRVEVLAVETEIRPLSVRRETTPLSTMYTQSSTLVPSDNQQLRSTVNTIIGREQNPYLRARALYDWVITNIHITEALSSPTGNIPSVLEIKQADPYSASLLYTAMARAASLPCIPVAGVLIDRNGRTLRHYWVEFWLDGFGWVPADIAMGAGAITEESGVITREDHVNYYFGNIDNYRIAFSRGALVLSQMENRGRRVSHTHSYSLQNIWEEASGGLESYTSLWGDVIISGIYVQ